MAYTGRAPPERGIFFKRVRYVKEQGFYSLTYMKEQRNLSFGSGERLTDEFYCFTKTRKRGRASPYKKIVEYLPPPRTTGGLPNQCTILQSSQSKKSLIATELLVSTSRWPIQQRTQTIQSHCAWFSGFSLRQSRPGVTKSALSIATWQTLNKRSRSPKRVKVLLLLLLLLFVQSQSRYEVMIRKEVALVARKKENPSFRSNILCRGLINISTSQNSIKENGNRLDSLYGCKQW